MTDRIEVLLNQKLLDRLALCGQKAGTDALDENMAEGNGVLNGLEVGRYLHPAAKVHHWRQAVTSFLETVVENLWVIVGYAPWKLATACTRTTGGADVKACSVRSV